MTPPIWLDEARRPCPIVPCPRCGRETALFRQRGTSFARQPDWRPFRVERHPSWCGHPVPTAYVPMGGGWWQEIWSSRGSRRRSQGRREGGGGGSEPQRPLRR